LGTLAVRNGNNYLLKKVTLASKILGKINKLDFDLTLLTIIIRKKSDYQTNLRVCCLHAYPVFPKYMFSTTFKKNISKTCHLNLCIKKMGFLWSFRRKQPFTISQSSLA